MTSHDTRSSWDHSQPLSQVFRTCFYLFYLSYPFHRILINVLIAQRPRSGRRGRMNGCCQNDGSLMCALVCISIVYGLSMPSNAPSLLRSYYHRLTNAIPLIASPPPPQQHSYRILPSAGACSVAFFTYALSLCSQARIRRPAQTACAPHEPCTLNVSLSTLTHDLT